MSRKGKTFEEMYGIEKAKEIKDKLRKLRIGKTFEEFFGEQKSKEIKNKISKSQKGISWEQRYGKEKTQDMKKEKSKIRKGKTLEEMHGADKAKEIKNNISNVRKGKTNIELYGAKRAEEIKIKKSISQKGINFEERYGPERSKEIIKKMSHILSQESKNKISMGQKLAWQDPKKRKNMENNGNKCKRGTKKDIGIYCRSTFEANYIRFLKWINIKYEYEGKNCIFKLSNGSSYTCDFYFPEIKTFLELKGYMRPESIKKYEIFKKEYPYIKWNILMQDSKEWKNIVINYSKKIPNFEYTKLEKSWINKVIQNV
jgi:hypothetical protein